MGRIIAENGMLHLKSREMRPIKMINTFVVSEEDDNSDVFDYVYHRLEFEDSNVCIWVDSNMEDIPELDTELLEEMYKNTF